MIARHALRALVALSALAGAFLGCRNIIGVQERTLDEVTCENYCSLVTSVCTGAHQQYASEAICLKMCPTFPVGTLDDSQKNTLGCRVREVKAIQDNGETDSCVGAGPGGAGICGSNCEAYCTSMDTLCPTQFATFEATGDAGCVSLCQNGILDCGGYDADASRNDDTMQCRLFHLTSAAGDSVTHCQHTIGQGGKCDEPLDGGCPTTN